MVVAIVTAVAGGVVAAAYFLGRTVLDSGRAKDAAVAFFTDLENGRYEDAYAKLCPETKQQFTPERFQQEFSTRKLTGHELTGELRVNGTPSGTTGTVGIKLTFADGTSSPELVPLHRADDGWHVCGDPY